MVAGVAVTQTTPNEVFAQAYTGWTQAHCLAAAPVYQWTIVSNWTFWLNAITFMVWFFNLTLDNNGGWGNMFFLNWSQAFAIIPCV